MANGNGNGKNDKDRTVFWLLLGLGAAVLVAKRSEAANGNGNGAGGDYAYGPGPIPRPFGNDWIGTVVAEPADNGSNGGTVVIDDSGYVPPVIPPGTTLVPACPPGQTMNPLTGNCGSPPSKPNGDTVPGPADTTLGDCPPGMVFHRGNCLEAAAGDPSSPQGQRRNCHPPEVFFPGDHLAANCHLVPYLPPPPFPPGLHPPGSPVTMWTFPTPPAPEPPPANGGPPPGEPAGAEVPCTPAPGIAFPGDYPAPGCVLVPYIPPPPFPPGVFPPPLLAGVPSVWSFPQPGGAHGELHGPAPGLNLAP